ncbi:40S ribosomal protein S2 [Cricetulus griseus]|uniref:40S ribosomal protein S2 n=1 Tax=Cricetulus griseus TaxID=10029 RepID=G3IA49_CRIGR|nr:40S ribosomal protein S2 [Cricetulus griseus]
MKIKNLEIYLLPLPIKQPKTIEFFVDASLKDEVLKVMPVQKQTQAGQRTRFKAFVTIGDYNGHVGLGVKCSKELATAIRGAIILAKFSIVPVWRGYWGNKIDKPHTVPCKVTGRCVSVLVGCTATLGNFAKATCYAIYKTYLTPTSGKRLFTKSPYQEFTDHLVKAHTSVSTQRTQAPAVTTI